MSDVLTRYYANNGQSVNFNINTEKCKNGALFYNHINVIQSSQKYINTPLIQFTHTTPRSKETNPKYIHKTRIKTHNEQWSCKCCCKATNNIKSKCILCHSARRHSENKPDENKDIITSGYCSSFNLNLPVIVIDLICEHVTFQKAKFHITWTKNEIKGIIKAHISSNVNANYVRYPKKVKLLQMHTYKFKFIEENDLLCMLRKNQNWNIGTEKKIFIGQICQSTRKYQMG
eukprot:60354_1